MKKMIKMVLILSSLLVVSLPSQANYVCSAKNLQSPMAYLASSDDKNVASSEALQKCQASEDMKHHSSCYVQGCVFQNHW